jgi:hypothetical protein
MDSRTSTLTITEYEVAFDEKSDGSTHRLWPYPLTSPVVEIDRLVNDTLYYVAIRSKNSAGGWSAFDWSEAAEGTPMAPEVPPLGTPMVTLEAGDGMITASWGAVEGADSYEVAWWPTGGGVISRIETSGMSYDLTGLTNGTEYEVEVSAMMGDMKGEASEIVRATPMAEAEPEPETLGVPAVVAVAGDASIMVSWTAVEGVDGYGLSWWADGGATTTMEVGMDVTEHTITGLTNGVTYMVAVTATTTPWASRATGRSR